MIYHIDIKLEKHLAFALANNIAGHPPAIFDLIFCERPDSGSELLKLDFSQKYHNAPFQYPTMHHFVTEMCMCTFLLQNGALWDICLMHHGICEMGLIRPSIDTSTLLVISVSGWFQSQFCITSISYITTTNFKVICPSSFNIRPRANYSWQQVGSRPRPDLVRFQGHWSHSQGHLPQGIWVDKLGCSPWHWTWYHHRWPHSTCA